jgi:hypothetical protein
VYLKNAIIDIDGLNGLCGTPTLYINGSIQDASFGLHTLIDDIEAILKKFAFFNW